MNAPKLVMTPRTGRWTADSLREHYRYRVRHLHGADKTTFAYGALSEIALRGGFTPVQMKAVAEGLALGMHETVRRNHLEPTNNES